MKLLMLYIRECQNVMIWIWFGLRVINRRYISLKSKKDNANKDYNSCRNKRSKNAEGFFVDMEHLPGNWQLQFPSNYCESCLMRFQFPHLKWSESKYFTSPFFANLLSNKTSSNSVECFVIYLLNWTNGEKSTLVQDFFLVKKVS